MAFTARETIAALDAIDAEALVGDEFTRNRVISAARNLIWRLQSPTDRCWELVLEQPVIIGSLHTLKNLGLWEAWAAQGGEKSLKDLTMLTTSPVDVNLLVRLVRLLVAAGMIDEVAEGRYKPNDFTTSLGRKETFGAMHIQAWADHYEVVGRNFANFFEKTSYRESVDASHTCYSDGFPEKLDFWARLTSNPAYQASFGGSMAAWSMNKTKWVNFFDTRALVSGADQDGPLLVDVGGNVGNDIQSFADKHPELSAGALILQDRPEALEHAKVNDKVRTMPHDFFTSQPVTGSRAYFFHAVFHDWDDQNSLIILRQIVPVMRRGYSKLLICDVVLPPTGATITQASMDVAMMMFLAARERTEAAWTKLLSDAELRITKLWPDPRGFETLIEAELA